MNKHIDSIVKRCAPMDMYDDNGYCDTKIKRLGVFYDRFVGGGGDCHCSECMLQLVLEAIKSSEKFTYEDRWMVDFELIREVNNA